MKLKQFVLFEKHTDFGMLIIATSDTLDTLKRKARKMYLKNDNDWCFTICDVIDGVIYDRFFSNNVSTKWHEYTVLTENNYRDIKYILMDSFGFNFFKFVS